MPDTALLLIATGKGYYQYVDQMVESARKFFVPHDAILWSDGKFLFHVERFFSKRPLGHPRETLHRYHTFLTQKWILSQYKYLFYVDIDATFVSQIQPEDIFSEGITATTHAGFLGESGTPETNPLSTAFMPSPPLVYFAGGFVGGKSEAFLEMAEEIEKNVDTDTRNGLIALWWDESHMNKYLYDHPPAKILDPGFCYPNRDREYCRSKWRLKGHDDFVERIRLIDMPGK